MQSLWAQEISYKNIKKSYRPQKSKHLNSDIFLISLIFF